MKTKKYLFSRCTVLLVLFLLSGVRLLAREKSVDQTLSGDEKKYAVLWNRMDSLEKKGLNRSASDLSVQIFNQAKSDRNSAQLVKAMIHRLKFQDYTEEDALIKNILSLESETKQAEYPERWLLHSMLAEIYWRYYQTNRYRFINRSEIIVPEDSNPATWDLRRIIFTCLQHFSSSLENSGESRKIPVSVFDAVIIHGSPEEVRSFRPTLYDFLAHRALDFYMNSETGLTEPVEIFTMDKAAYLGDADEYIKLPLISSDTSNLKYKACILFQQVLSFHAADADPRAFIDADLKRIGFVYAQSSFHEKDSVYENTLMRLASKYRMYPESAEALYQLAVFHEQKGNLYNAEKSDANKWELVKALQYCDSAILRNPSTRGAIASQNMKARLQLSSLSFLVENVNPMGRVFRARVEYKNLNSLFFRVYPDNSESYPENERYGELLIKRLLQTTAVKTWSVNLPVDTDLQRHSIEAGMPSLDFGKYILVLSGKEEISLEQSGVAYGNFRISDMSLLSRRLNDGAYEFYVLDRFTGGPMHDVAVEASTKQYDNSAGSYQKKIVGNYVSDDEGHFVVEPSGERQRNLNLELQHGNDRLILDENFYQYNFPQRSRTRQEHTVFFTDRSIYRPGQLIYFKALLLDVTESIPKILPNQRTTIQFFDVNGQLVTEEKLQSNEYGTVQGVFTAPTGMLNGLMRLQNESGSRTLNIEEYKRPRFESSFNTAKGSYRLGEEIEMTGNAKTYSGVPVDGARVAYRVTRLSNFPDWCYWYRGIYPQQPAREILNGSTMTDSAGNFSISFNALPDASLPKESEPVFTFELKADITDLNGETRSIQTTLRVAYTSLELSSDFPEALDMDSKGEYKIMAKNFSGNTEAAKLSVEVYRIKEPERLIRSREWAWADKRIFNEEEYIKQFPSDVYDREDDFLRWEKERTVWKGEKNTATDSLLSLTGVDMDPGFYLLEIKTQDIYGVEVKFLRYFTAFHSSSTSMPRKAVNWFRVIKDDAHPGEEDKVLIGSAVRNVRVMVETEVKNKIVSRQFIRLNNEQRLIRIPVKEEYRGNFSLHLTFVKDGRVYSQSVHLKVPWQNKELSVEYETFRSTLEPGKKEEWKIRLKDYQGGKVMAELLMSMYDASLDAFKPHSWKTDIYSSYYSSLALKNHLFKLSYSDFISNKRLPFEEYVPRSDDQLNWYGYEFSGYYAIQGRAEMLSMAMDDEGAGRKKVEVMRAEPNLAASPAQEELKSTEGSGNVEEVQLRRNLQETAFFYPRIEAGDDGSYVVSFTTPEALTRWKMQLFAHTTDLKFVFAEKEIVTRKELMVMPNLPRFLRAGDAISISTKINSLSESMQEGKVTLHLLDAFTMKPVDSLFNHSSIEKSFSVSKDKSDQVSWKLSIPENMAAVVIRISARAGNFSDGEEQLLPVLTNRQLVTESLPFWTRGKEIKTFELKKLTQNSSASLEHHRLTLEYTANPVWTVVQALPYMMEAPYPCSEQIFSRYYANSIASYIANSSPRIKAIFQNWKALTPESFLSKLEKNQELKSVVLEETPWVMDAKEEKERKERVALLFDVNRMANEQRVALLKLQKAQGGNGAWSWFEGMPEDRYITQYIVTGLAQLQQLGLLSPEDMSKTNAMIQQAVKYLDRMVAEDYQRLVGSKTDLTKYIPSSLQVQYLYLRSFNTPMKVKNETASVHDYLLAQAGKYWLSYNEYLKGMLALAQYREGKSEQAKGILKSLKENAQRSDELGMYWKNNTGGYYWSQAKVETQALLIEAFHEIEKDQEAVEEMKLWLLRQKQTHNWKSSKATAEACYALLLSGKNWLEEENVVRISIGSQTIQTDDSGLNQEAGTGSFSISWDGNEIQESMGKIQVTPLFKKDSNNDKPDESGNVSWGALYWQYFEDLDKISAAGTDAIHLSKSLFIQRAGSTGPIIEKIESTTALYPGDRIVVRIELRTDRDMEYIHLKDLRAAGLEPENVLSSYKWQDGLGYYESTRDASTDFFISNLQRGTYVFEYPLRAVQEGFFSSGITSIQNMYAPEFSAHSTSGKIRVLSR